MAHTITIKYTSPSAPSAQPIAGICRTFVPTNAAADSSVFADTYYDTNVEGWGEGTAIEEFMNSVVAHPGLVAAIRKAIADGTYTMTDASDADALYMGEVAKVLEGQGIVVQIDGKAS